MSFQKHVLLPRFADLDNHNAQNLNAKALVGHFRLTTVRWSMVCHHTPIPEFSTRENVDVFKLRPLRLWKPLLSLWYQQEADAIFYPGWSWADALGLKTRLLSGRRIPLISTLEGLVGDDEREKRISKWVDHPVFCQKVDKKSLERIDRIYQDSDQIIAISPFLAEIGCRLYGDKISSQFLGIDNEIFYSRGTPKPARPRVINVANVNPHKRPDMFFSLARRYPYADFVWIGGGPQLQALRNRTAEERLTNLQFLGLKTPSQLAEEYRNASVFALPSNAEGVPKVTQEAAACGLPIVIFGYYEAPTVENGINGFVVWSDADFIERVGTLISDSTLAGKMGCQSVALSMAWPWESIAERWEREILRVI